MHVNNNKTIARVSYTSYKLQSVGESRYGLSKCATRLKYARNVSTKFAGYRIAPPFVLCREWSLSPGESPTSGCSARDVYISYTSGDVAFPPAMPARELPSPLSGCPPECRFVFFLFFSFFYARDRVTWRYYALVTLISTVTMAKEIVAQFLSDKSWDKRWRVLREGNCHCSAATQITRGNLEKSLSMTCS